MRPILLLEINEVPWKLLDYYLDDKRLPTLHYFFKNSLTYTTVSEDTGELSPWITWPSFHRGMSNTQHGIQFLGQDPKSFRGVAIWEEYRKQGLSIGIGGSLQSWPPQDPGANGFYVPDTFAHDESCIPKWIEPLQKFNLKQTRANVRVVSSTSIFSMESVALFLNLHKLGIRLKTIIAIVKQLIGEKINRKRVARRPTFQALLYWDVFRKLYNPENPPAFSTFFTNHVASAMHRFWHHVFPSDFGNTYANSQLEHADTMFFAMNTLEMILQEALEYQKKNPDLILVFASSMGQNAKVWEKYKGYAFSIPDVTPLMRKCGLSDNEFTPLLAMTPQVCVEIKNDSRRNEIRDGLLAARTASGVDVFKIEELQDRLSITTPTASPTDIDAGQFTLFGQPTTWEDAGIHAHKVDAASGYHIPEGAMAVLGKNIPANNERTTIKAREAKALLLKFAGLSPRENP